MATTLDKYRDIFGKKAFVHLATVGPDGRPQVTPVWADFDGTHIRINTARGRIKDRNLKANPRVALSAQDPDNPDAERREFANSSMAGRNNIGS